MFLQEVNVVILDSILAQVSGVKVALLPRPLWACQLSPSCAAGGVGSQTDAQSGLITTSVSAVNLFTYMSFERQETRSDEESKGTGCEVFWHEGTQMEVSSGEMEEEEKRKASGGG